MENTGRGTPADVCRVKRMLRFKLSESNQICMIKASACLNKSHNHVNALSTQLRYEGISCALPITFKPIDVILND